jgi:hypothetical protein
MRTRGRPASRGWILLASILIGASGVTLSALGGRVARVRAVSGQVRAALELRDAFPESLRQVLERGGTLHVRVDAGLWEDRAMWDCAVDARRVTAFRVLRQPDGDAIAVVDTGGGVTTYRAYPQPLTVDIDVAPVDKLDDDTRYYLDASVTIGSLNEEELAEANDAVFGPDDGPAGLKRVGKFLLNTVLQVSDYVRSVSTEIRSSRYAGAELKRP